MRRILHRSTSVALAVAISLGPTGSSHAQDSSFARLEFGGNIYVEIPRHWTFLDDNLRKHVKTATEAITRIPGSKLSPHESLLLVAANAYTSSSVASATIQLGVRRRKTLTQVELREMSKRPDLAQLLAPVAEKTRQLMVRTRGIKNVTVLAARVATNYSLVCFLVELQVESELPDRAMETQIYSCPVGDGSVELSTSYRKAEAAMFRPVAEYVWQSLRVK